MTPEKPDLDVLARLVGEMTPGPWTIRPEHEEDDHDHVLGIGPPLIGQIELFRVDYGEILPNGRGVDTAAPADTQAIVALRNAAEWLIQRARDAERYEAEDSAEKRLHLSPGLSPKEVRRG